MVTMTPDRLRQLRRVGVYAAFGLIVFVVALYASFPYDRAKDAATRIISKTFDVDVEIGSAGPAFGVAVMFRDIRVRTRPTTGKPTRFTIDSAKFSPSLFSLFSSSFPTASRRKRWAARSRSTSPAHPARRAPSGPTSSRETSTRPRSPG